VRREVCAGGEGAAKGGGPRRLREGGFETAELLVVVAAAKDGERVALRILVRAAVVDAASVDDAVDDPVRVVVGVVVGARARGNHGVT